MQQKKSVNFDDWKEAYKNGFDGFILECGSGTAQEYIEKFSQMAEVKSTPVFRSDGVHVTFKRDIPGRITEGKLEESIGFSFTKSLIIGFIAGFILTFLVTYVVFSLESERDLYTDTVIVQNNIIPRRCYMVPFVIETGFSIMITEIGGDDEFYIEIEDYESFFNEYLEKR